jgi:uncharacterized protein YaiE (UPF0345 family)
MIGKTFIGIFNETDDEFLVLGKCTKETATSLSFNDDLHTYDKWNLSHVEEVFQIPNQSRCQVKVFHIRQEKYKSSTQSDPKIVDPTSLLN